MVDFNNDTIVGVPAQDIERVLILQARNDFIIAHEHYKKEKRLSNFNDTTIISTRLQSLFLEIQALLKRRLSKEDYENIYNNIMNGQDYDKILNSFIIMYMFRHQTVHH